MKPIKFPPQASSKEELEGIIKEALKFKEVVSDDKEAEEYYFKCYEIPGDKVIHRITDARTLSVWDDEHNGEVRYSFVLTEHIIDPGLEHVYSYQLT